VPFAYFDRLSAAKKRIYLRSDSIEKVEVSPDFSVDCELADIRAALEGEQRAALQKVSQRMMDALAAEFGVPRIKVKVLSVRPSGDWGELHGLYEPGPEGEPAVVSTWMRTVARKQVVAYKTFVRTLLHEFCHHLDYELYQLAETFHTEGFYKREASLFRRLHGLPEPGSGGKS